MENDSKPERKRVDRRTLTLANIAANEGLFRKTLASIKDDQSASWVVGMPPTFDIEKPVDDLVKEQFGAQYGPNSSFGKFSIYYFHKGPCTYMGEEVKDNELVIEAGNIATLSGHSGALKYRVLDTGEVTMDKILTRAMS